METIKQTLVEGTDIGNLKSEAHVGSFFLKFLIYLVPGIFFGNIIDQSVDKFKNYSVTKRVFLQIFLNIFLYYILHRMLKPYTDELQITLAGLLFTSGLFGMQTNLITNLQKLLNK
jgi:membrane protein DedA with SNARE-associated domain